MDWYGLKAVKTLEISCIFHPLLKCKPGLRCWMWTCNNPWHQYQPSHTKPHILAPVNKNKQNTNNQQTRPGWKCNGRPLKHSLTSRSFSLMNRLEH